MNKPGPVDFGRRDVMRLAGLAALAAAAPIPAFAQTAKLKIATIGAGREGGALGTQFAKAGHPVMFSSRHPEELKDLVEKAGPNAKAGTVAEAVAFGDVVLLVVPYTAIAAIGKEYGPALAKKQLVMDVSNPIPRRDGDPFVKQVMDEGGPGVVTMKALDGAKVVRAFNAIGAGTLADLGQRQGEAKIGVPIAGDDQGAIRLASELIREIGFEPVLVGSLEAMGKYLVPGTPLAGAHTPAEIRTAAANLK
jgi:8-hydroxy-5-deazaflavin:NADPH oxidoreductase